MIMLQYQQPKLHIPHSALRKGWKRWATHGNGAETSQRRETDGLEITEAKSQKIDHIQQNGRSD